MHWNHQLVCWWFCDCLVVCVDFCWCFSCLVPQSLVDSSMFWRSSILNLEDKAWQKGDPKIVSEMVGFHGDWPWYKGHRIHVWYISLHLVDFYGKCRWIYHTWILWEVKKIHSLKLTATSPLKIGHIPKGNEKVFQPSTTSGAKMLVSGRVILSKSRWWFQIFFIFIPIWGRFPFWLIFFKWVETTN